jgi:DNA-binding NarL/FixJ family response regulator
MERFLFRWEEYQRLLERCPFTDEEIKVLELRRKNCSVTEMAFKLNISERTVNRRIESIKNKISLS